MSIKYNAKILAAVALAISTEKTRYYLNGVCIQGRQAVATDGHIMTVASDDSLPAEENDDTARIFPISKQAITAMKKKAVDHVLFENDTLAVVNDMQQTTYLEPCEEVDGTFPDWKRVLPETDSEVAYGSFAPDLLIRIANSAKILANGSGKIPISLRGEDDTKPHLVTYHGIEQDLFSVLMPMRK